MWLCFWFLFEYDSTWCHFKNYSQEKFSTLFWKLYRSPQSSIRVYLFHIQVLFYTTWVKRSHSSSRTIHNAFYMINSTISTTFLSPNISQNMRLFIKKTVKSMVVCFFVNCFFRTAGSCADRQSEIKFTNPRHWFKCECFFMIQSHCPQLVVSAHCVFLFTI